MRPFNIISGLGCAAIFALTLQSCRDKTTGLDNLTVITKPYSLHFADSMGMLYSTYDGERFDLLNGSGGVRVEALWTTDKYILMKMPFNTTLFVDDGGQGTTNNMNPSYANMNPAAFGQGAVINLVDYNDTGAKKLDRVYATSASGSGVVFNDSNANGEWSGKGIWYSVMDTALGSSAVTSFTYTEDKKLYAYSDGSRRLWVKENLGAEWRSRATVGLPAAVKSTVFSQKNDVLVAVIDGTATDRGIWRSTNGGHSFSQLPNLPNDIGDISCAAAPFGKVVIACTRNNGIFRLSAQGAWEYASYGLEKNTRIYGITYKSNAFKNNKQGEYVFVATSNGIYRSDDLGQNWVRLPTKGNTVFTAIH